MNKDIDRAMDIINGSSRCCNYDSTYLFSNENVAGLVDNIDLKDKKILTVCSSSDQVFNFLLKNPSCIETFDINIFTKYLFYLKRAAILSLDREGFLDFFLPKFFNRGRLFNNDTYGIIRENIECDYVRLFWDVLFACNNERKLYKSPLFFEDNLDREVLVSCNNYLMNDDAYYTLREKLKKINNINFWHLNLFKDDLLLDTKFDFIYLSNIFDYLSSTSMSRYLSDISDVIMRLEKNLSDDGKIGLCYLYCFRDGYWNSIDKYNLQAAIQNWVFNMADCELISFNSSLNYNSSKIHDRDCVIVKKKKLVR